MWNFRGYPYLFPFVGFPKGFCSILGVCRNLLNEKKVSSNDSGTGSSLHAPNIFNKKRGFVTYKESRVLDSTRKNLDFHFFPENPAGVILKKITVDFALF